MNTEDTIKANEYGARHDADEAAYNAQRTAMRNRSYIVDCPRCTAKVGERCVTHSGNATSAPHRSRHNRANAAKLVSA